MPSENLETIFRRDLDRLPGLADDQLVPRGRGSAQPVSLGSVLALVGILVAAVVIALSLQAVRDADRSNEESAASPSPYFVVDGAGAAATASPSTAAAPSPAPTWLVGPPASDPLLGVPTCPRGSGPILRIANSSPPGDLPGTGAATAEAAFRGAYPNVRDFTMFPFGSGSAAPVWIVAGGETYVVNYSGGPGLNSWFAHPAKYVGCYTPEPRTPRPSGLPSAAPTSFG
jgi:hypothetical protein